MQEPSAFIVESESQRGKQPAGIRAEVVVSQAGGGVGSCSHFSVAVLKASLF